ncbi:MAG: hypothetical protein EBE86_028610 [Hormoscilla sp. GUM202]|nr:hypothetical protein [Hormoscilla sp. GUM202]
MLSQEVLTVKQGIWIDKSWLLEAGLGSSLQLLVKQGEIRISPAEQLEAEQSKTADTETGWEVFLSLEKDGHVGKLPNTSIHHDRYLYGKE